MQRSTEAPSCTPLPHFALPSSSEILSSSSKPHQSTHFPTKLKNKPTHETQISPLLTTSLPPPMAMFDNQQTFLPYSDTINKDCSQGFCNIYCPQWCYILFSPPPPLSLSALDDDSATAFSPLVIAIIAILASALLLVSYYTFVSKNCAFFSFNRRSVHFEEDSGGGGVASVRHEEWHVSPSNGLEEAQIKKIAFLRYRKEGSIVDGTECSVCLGEFREEEELRLLPKCRHAFHLQCIDTWLKSHANCPLCRANIVLEPDEQQAGVVMTIEEEEEEEEETDAVEIGEEVAEPVWRCLSVGSSEAYRGQVSIADVLQMSMEEEYMVAKSCGLVREGEGEQNRGNGRNRGLNCVMRTVRMKRSVSSGRFFFGKQRRGRNFLLPV